MAKHEKIKELEVIDRVDVSQRLAIGLVALSLSAISLALGIAFISSPAVLLVLPSTTTESTPSSATAVTITWTAPGDDGDIGTADHYDIRYSTAPITADNFSQAQIVSTPPLPQSAGSTESHNVINLQPSTTYFFALKAYDESDNVSDISNIASKTTDELAVACVPIYLCTSWTTCINGYQTRICTVTNGCETGLDMPITIQQCTVPPVVIEPVVEPVVTPTTNTTVPTTTVPDTGGEETVTITNPMLVAGVATRTIPVVRTINPYTRVVMREWLTMSRTDRNGIHVAVGDVTGDHRAEVIVGSGLGSDPLVKIFNDRGQQMFQFNPYPTSYKIGVAVATGDVDGNGTDEILTVAAGSAAHVRIFKYRPTESRVEVIAQTFAYDYRQRNGFTIAAGDIDLDGMDEFAVAARTYGSTVTVMQMKGDRTIQTLTRFSPYGRTFHTGLTLAIGDTNGDGRGDIITTPGPEYWSHIKVFDGRGRNLTDFLPTSTAYRGGVSLATFDINRDGKDEIITGSYSRGDPGVWIWRWNALRRRYERIQAFFVYPRTMQDGLRISAAPHI